MYSLPFTERNDELLKSDLTEVMPLESIQKYKVKLAPKLEPKNLKSESFDSKPPIVPLPDLTSIFM